MGKTMEEYEVEAERYEAWLSGLFKEFSPLPSIIKSSLFLLILTPISCKAFKVLEISSDQSRLDICVNPFAIDGIIIDLCEIDLSPGIFILPLIPFTIFELTSIKF